MNASPDFVSSTSPDEDVPRLGRRATSAEARERIIAAAEILFAERGIEAVSLREIAVAAGHGNNNAVQYHFGSKAGLVQAIFHHRVGQMEEPRHAMLAEAEAQGRLGDVRTLLDILCLPLLDLVDGDGRHTYAGFLAQYVTRYRPGGLQHAADEVSEVSTSIRRLLELIAQRISYVPPALAQSRIALCALAFHNMLVRADAEHLKTRDRAAFDALVHDTIEIMAVALSAPYRHS
ncbi:hypothetical protein ACFB49_22350 [Sphingomonas sp. DBB INV C78]|uniref:TetR/AcrR family transcriptional regulator n=1 Tax=Sphingomonas sp. DBB INV C78 TaxID=3349434 RepID=UPI0036D4263F